MWGDISSTQETEYSVSSSKGESSYFVYLQYLVNNNVLQTFVEGLHALRQILLIFTLPISH